jgi:hypothetical protein
VQRVAEGVSMIAAAFAPEPVIRGVDGHDPIDLPGGVCLRLHLGQQLLPGAVLGPTVEPLVDRVSIPEPLRHVSYCATLASPPP